MAENPQVQEQEPYEDIRYTGADEIGVTTAEGTHFVKNGDVVSVPTREVEAWPTPPPADWERVNAPVAASSTATPQAATPVQPVNTPPGVPAPPAVSPVVAAPTEPTAATEPTP